jgi:hypothetical protein
MTPEQLAIELGVSAKTMRAWLRLNFPRPAAQKGSNWELAPEQVMAVREWCGSRDCMRPGATTNQRASTAAALASPPNIRWDVRFERSFHRHRFRGFVPLGEAVADRREFLRQHEHDLISAGVYAIFVSIDYSPTWETPGLANVINPWSVAQLRARWVTGAELVYIGCAGSTPSSRALHKRIRDLLRHGAGAINASGPHKGGERIWQCVGWDSFTLAWKPTGAYPEPHNLEVAIGRRFEVLTGQLTFANLRL